MDNEPQELLVGRQFLALLRQLRKDSDMDAATYYSAAVILSTLIADEVAGAINAQGRGAKEMEDLFNCFSDFWCEKRGEGGKFKIQYVPAKGSN